MRASREGHESGSRDHLQESEGGVMRTSTAWFKESGHGCRRAIDYNIAAAGPLTITHMAAAGDGCCCS